MLFRIGVDHPASASTLAACAEAVAELASHWTVALIEPFMVHKLGGRTPERPDARRSDPVDGDRVRAGIPPPTAGSRSHGGLDGAETEASALPLLLLGGDADDRPEEMFTRWQKALQLPGMRGLVADRNLLYPPGDDVAVPLRSR